MILPQPESNLKTNLMVLGADIISIMGNSPFKNKYVIVDDIMNKFLNRDKDRTPDLFLYALTFLHTIGSIEKKGYKIKLVKKESQEKIKQVYSTMLIRIYSETNLIDAVPFHNGINIILGKYSGDKEARGINGIGKSTLVRLVDFTLLSGKAEKDLLKKV
jgi:hypothetical protein